MRRGVTYQSPAGASRDAAAAGTYVRLGEGAITTRRKDAGKTIEVAVSAPQRRWLREATDLSGAGIDEGQVVRALIDLGMQLDLDWAVIAKGRSLRGAVRESVMVRRRPAD